LVLQRGNRLSGLGCSLSRVTYSLHEPRDQDLNQQTARGINIFAEGVPGMAVVLNKTDLPFLGNSHELEGYLYGDAPVCIILFDGPPGSGPKLHRHPYAELFLVQEGNATFTVGEDIIDVTGGQIVVAPAGVPHKFVNSGAGPLRQIDIHANDRFVTEWLEG
jgi:mannose-6-phosphate isomerase-like protein (cupin superfamily)